MDPAKMVEYLTRRYGPKGRPGRGEYDEDYDDDEIPDEITQQSLLPDVKSPSLWPVKCRMGEEKQTALLLMRKFLMLENDDKVSRMISDRLTRSFSPRQGLANQIRGGQRR